MHHTKYKFRLVKKKDNDVLQSEKKIQAKSLRSFPQTKKRETKKTNPPNFLKSDYFINIKEKPTQAADYKVSSSHAKIESATSRRATKNLELHRSGWSFNPFSTSKGIFRVNVFEIDCLFDAVIEEIRT